MFPQRLMFPPPETCTHSYFACLLYSVGIHTINQNIYNLKGDVSIVHVHDYDVTGLGESEHEPSLEPVSSLLALTAACLNWEFNKVNSLRLSICMPYFSNLPHSPHSKRHCFFILVYGDGMHSINFANA